MFFRCFPLQNSCIAESWYYIHNILQYTMKNAWIKWMTIYKKRAVCNFTHYMIYCKYNNTVISTIFPSLSSLLAFWSNTESRPSFAHIRLKLQNSFFFFKVFLGAFHCKTHVVSANDNTTCNLQYTTCVLCIICEVCMDRSNWWLAIFTKKKKREVCNFTHYMKYSVPQCSEKNWFFFQVSGFFFFFFFRCFPLQNSFLYACIQCIVCEVCMDLIAGYFYILNIKNEQYVNVHTM